MRFSHNNLAIRRVLSPASVSDNTARIGEIVNARGFDGLEYVIAAGSLADSDATFTVLLEHGSAPDLSDAAAVPDSQLLGTEALAGFTFSDDDKVFKLGYVGRRPYTRLTITPSGNASAALIMAFAVLGFQNIAIGDATPLDEPAPVSDAVSTPVPLLLDGISNIAIVYAVTKVVADYNGPVWQVARLSDGAALDIYPDANNRPVETAVPAFLGAEVGRMIPYDQRGGTGLAPVTDLTICPKYKPNTFNGLPSFCFDGYAKLPTFTQHAGKRLPLPTISIDRKTMGLMVLGQEIQQGNTGPIIELLDSGTGLLRYYTALGTGTNTAKRLVRMDATTFTPGSGIGGLMCSSPDLHGFATNGETTGNLTFYNEDRNIVSNSKTTTTLIGGAIGGRTDINQAGADFTGDIAMIALFNGTPSGSDFSTVRARAVTPFGLSVPTDTWIVGEGDSLTGGLGCDQNGARTIATRALLQSAGHTVRYDNLGLVGETAAVMLAATNVNAQIVPRREATRKIIVSLLCNTNDIRSNPAADTAALATSYLAFCASQMAAGSYMIAATLPPIGASGVSGGQTYNGAEAARQDFNARIRAGSTNYHGLADYALDSIVGPQSGTEDPSLFPDGLHGSKYTQQQRWAPIEVAAILPFL